MESGQKNLYNAIYLEGDDISDDGSISSKLVKGIPSIVMIQGSFCGHCAMAKPDFDKFAKQYSGFTIQIDGSEGDKQAFAKIQASFGDKFKGVPTYYYVDSNGKFKGMYEGGRKLSDLIQFYSSIKD